MAPTFGSTENGALKTDINCCTLQLDKQMQTIAQLWTPKKIAL